MDTQLSYQGNHEEKGPAQISYKSSSRWTSFRCFFELSNFFRENTKIKLLQTPSILGPWSLEESLVLGPTFEGLMKHIDKQAANRLKITAFNHDGKMLAGCFKNSSTVRKMDYRVIELGNMPYSTIEFDGVTIANSFHCIPDLGAALIEIRRILKVKGTLAGNALLRPQGTGTWGKFSRYLYDRGLRYRIWNRSSNDKVIKRALEKQGFMIVFQEKTGEVYNFIAQKI